MPSPALSYTYKKGRFVFKNLSEVDFKVMPCEIGRLGRLVEEIKEQYDLRAIEAGSEEAEEHDTEIHLVRIDEMNDFPSGKMINDIKSRITDEIEIPNLSGLNIFRVLSQGDFMWIRFEGGICRSSDVDQILEIVDDIAGDMFTLDHFTSISKKDLRKGDPRYA